MKNSELGALNDIQIAKVLTDLFIAFRKEKEGVDASAYFYATQDVIAKLALVKKYTTYIKVDFENNKVEIKTVKVKPAKWGYTHLRDCLRSSCVGLLQAGLILSGFEMEYNKDSISLQVGEDPTKDRKMAIGFIEPKKKGKA